MVSSVADRVSALMSTGGQHGCWSVAALPLLSGTCETRGTRGTFSSFELVGRVRGIGLLLLAGFVFCNKDEAHFIDVAY